MPLKMFSRSFSVYFHYSSYTVFTILIQFTSVLLFFPQICIAPSLGEVNETKCSLNFGLRAMRITNVARLNVEVNT